ncbi:MAG: tRNA (N6-isopentenyl adenosine(37)-C2)-methylthiotransferase MiaB [Desulfuromonadales bacterium]|nr:tRNA (N6-isopentenyl adenosine(37)-C2)-methylthiotransferase MiaB [Desulfuromonadales bacterium]
MKSKNLYIETFGCQMNVNDSERIVSMLADAGYSPDPVLKKADMILLNTCSVRGGAEERVYNRLENLRVLKKANRRLVIGVGGCVAQHEGELLLEKFPWVDLVFGTHNLHLLPDMVKAAEQGQRRSETSFIDNDQRLELFPAVQESSRVSRFVTIMQGCDNFCSYCIVPFVRGREVSRRSDEIREEVRLLAESGVKEIVLLGQNVNSYGLNTPDQPSFAGLIRQLAEIEGIRRIRFTTSHPKDMSDELIACFSDIPKVCGQIQLPAQSGSNAVLKRMNRGYTRESYLDRIRALKSARPGIVITGDMIVGFPGETEEDFEQTMALIEEVRYADVYSFVYSPRPGTRAAEFPEEITREQKQERLERLLKVVRRITLEINSSFTGTIQSILVEGLGKRPGQVSGRADSGKTVNFIGSPDLIGSFVDVRIVAAYQNSLAGEII